MRTRLDVDRSSRREGQTGALLRLETGATSEAAGPDNEGRKSLPKAIWASIEADPLDTLGEAQLRFDFARDAFQKNGVFTGQRLPIEMSPYVLVGLVGHFLAKLRPLF